MNRSVSVGQGRIRLNRKVRKFKHKVVEYGADIIIKGFVLTVFGLILKYFFKSDLGGTEKSLRFNLLNLGY